MKKKVKSVKVKPVIKILNIQYCDNRFYKAIEERLRLEKC